MKRYYTLLPFFVRQEEQKPQFISQMNDNKSEEQHIASSDD